MQTIFFFYGLAFLAMGTTIFLMPKERDLFGLSRDLWLVGLFGILHGLNEWVDLFILRGSPFNAEVLTVFGALLLPLSFAPLLQFGMRVLFRENRSFRSLKHLWMIPLMGWAIACFLTHGFLVPGIVARYFLGFPGAILTAAGLLHVFLRTDKEKLPGTVSAGVIGAVAVFILYGILSGLVVPKAGFLPAFWINTPHFLQVTGVPVQFFRMVCAILLAVSFFMFTGIYAVNLEKKKVERRGGIQRKITLMLCGFSGMAALLTVGLVFAWSYQSITANIGQEQLKVTSMLSRSVSDLLDQEVEELYVHLSSGLWEQSVEDADLRYSAMSPAEIMKDMQDKDQQWIHASPDSALIKSTLETPMSRRLKSLAGIDVNVAEIFLTDRYGGLVAASEKTSDFYQADESWWQKAYAGGKGAVFLGDIAVDESSGVLSLIVARPIRNESGEVIGICKESINVEIFFSSLKAYKNGKTGHASLIDEQGNILYHTGIKPLSVKLLSEPEMQLVIQRKTGLVKKEEGIHRGQTLLISAKKLDDPLLHENGIAWYLCVSQDQEEVVEPLKKLVAEGVLLLLVLLAGAIFSGIFVGERFAKPIRELQKATERIMAGGMDYKIEIRTADEIQEFAESFNAMIADLRKKQDSLLMSRLEFEVLSQELEKKVGERTRELSAGQQATMNILEDLTETNEKLKKFTEELTRAKNDLEAKSRQLQRSEEFLKHTGEMAKVGGWELDLATRVVSWTDETYRIHELEIGTAPSLDAAIHYYTPESLAILQEAMRKTSETGEMFDLELEIITVKTHKRLWVRSVGRAVYDDGKIVKLRGTFQDIDARKKVENDLKAQTTELELQFWGLQKANDGIKALYQELTKKNIDLAKLDHLKDDFVSIVAHELRNPLGVVREAASLILDGLVGPVAEEQRKYIEMIKNTGDRLIHITTDLLDLAKIEAGKIVVNYEPMDLLSVARQACEGIALRAHKKGLTVTEDFPGGPLQILGDFDKLSQVMINLLSNAFKFTEKGGITVEVRDLGEEVRCAVKDTGPGISEENLKRLFSKFEQFGKPTTSTEKGSGLGLVISQSIVLAHGGRIWAESKPGEGTILFFTLPKKPKKKQKLGEILLEEKALTPEQLAEALKKQNGQKAS